MALALEFCFWLCLSCLKPYLLLHFDSIMWLQLGPAGYALVECSVGFFNSLGSGAWTLLSLGVQGMAVSVCCGPALKMLGQSSSRRVGGKSAARGNLQAASPKVYHCNTMEQTAASCLFECCLPDNCVKAKSVVFNLTCLGFAFKGLMLRMPVSSIHPGFWCSLSTLPDLWVLLSLQGQNKTS